ncbi:MAG: hypothetical protein ACSHYA_13475 [Opitutaceae bacterium]
MEKFQKCKELLLVECKLLESSESFLTEFSKYYDQRLEDHEWGALYDIGDKYLLNGKDFFHIRTFAGSLVLRIFLESKKGQFPRRVAMYWDDENAWELTQSNGETRRIPSSELKKDIRREMTTPSSATALLSAHPLYVR